MPPPNRRWTEPAALALFCAFLFFFGLGAFGLVGADEPRYAQIAREMLARHDWVTPTLGGNPWLEKPVLYYWQAMLSYMMFGVSDWAARVPGAVSASAMIAAIYLFMRRFRSGSQFDVALIAASSAGVIGFARAASTDMPLAAAFTIGMLGWLAWLFTGRRLWLAGFYGFIALGALAKGPVAPALAAAIIVLFALAHRDWRLIVRTLWIPGILLFCAVALPWYIAVQMRNPEFFRVFILQHNLARFGTNLFRHERPLWFFVPVLLLGIVPWTTFFVAGLVHSIRSCIRLRTSGDTPDYAAQTHLPTLLVIWTIVFLVFFSFSQSKLPGYVLPAIPACAMLAGDYVFRRLSLGRPVHVVILSLHSALAALTFAAALLAPYRIQGTSAPAAARDVAAALGAVIFVAMTITLRRSGLRILRFTTLVPVILAIAFLLRLAAPTLDNALSARPLARILEQTETTRAPIAVFHVRRSMEYGLAFYRNQVIQSYDRAEIPVSDHMLVAASGTESELARLLPGRRLSHLGTFAPQQLDYYWVSTPREHHH